MQDSRAEVLEERLVVVGSAAQDGAEARMIRLETSFGRGFAGLQMIGNTGQIVEHGKERAKMALERLGYALPARRLLISVSPGNIKVDGNHLDLACAIGIAGQIRETKPIIDPSRWVFAAEMGIGGELRPVPAVVCHGVAAMASGMDGVVVALDNLPELRALEAVSAHTSRPVVYRAFRHLSDVLDWLWTGDLVELADELPAELVAQGGRVVLPDFDDMDLVPELSLAACVAAAGMHSLLLRGVPGCGKSMFARRLVSLLPDLSAVEHLTALQIHSAHPERIAPGILAGRPPYRSPHHLASASAMLGTGPCPGEVALASGGVLFLDEFPEFRRDVIEALREPLESGEVQVSRAHAKRIWRAKMMLIAAANNCPCGWRGSKMRRCVCPETKVSAYNNRISGPILDRIDMHLSMPERGASMMGVLMHQQHKNMHKTAGMRDLVSEARLRASNRNQNFGCVLNRDIPAQHLAAALAWSAEDLDFAVCKIIPSHVSTRAVVRCLRVARTIADISGRPAAILSDMEQAWSWQSHEAALRRGETSHLALKK